MKKFCVLLHAQNVWILNELGQPALGGAYTWRIVEAENRKQAGEIAAGSLLADQKFLEEIWNPDEDPPQVAADEINRLRSKDAENSGLVFYFEDEEESSYRGEESRRN